VPISLHCAALYCKVISSVVNCAMRNSATRPLERMLQRAVGRNTAADCCLGGNTSFCTRHALPINTTLLNLVSLTKVIILLYWSPRSLPGPTPPASMRGWPKTSASLSAWPRGLHACKKSGSHCNSDPTSGTFCFGINSFELMNRSSVAKQLETLKA
jgi:hypothetical protein